MYPTPNTTAAPIGTLSNGAEVVLVDQVVSLQGKLLSEIRDEHDRTGYIDGAVKVVETAARRNTATRDMLIGGGLCAGGIAATVITYTMASSSVHGGTYIIAWGPALFGAIQFIRGLDKLGKRSPKTSLLDHLLPRIMQEKTAGRNSGTTPTTGREPGEFVTRVCNAPRSAERSQPIRPEDRRRERSR